MLLYLVKGRHHKEAAWPSHGGEDKTEQTMVGPMSPLWCLISLQQQRAKSPDKAPPCTQPCGLSGIDMGWVWNLWFKAANWWTPLGEGGGPHLKRPFVPVPRSQGSGYASKCSLHAQVSTYIFLMIKSSIDQNLCTIHFIAYVANPVLRIFVPFFLSGNWRVIRITPRNSWQNSEPERRSSLGLAVWFCEA